MKKLVLLFCILSLSAQASMLYGLDKGVNLFRENNLKGAVDYFQNYINSNPNDEDGYFWLGKTYSAQNMDYHATIAFKKAYSLALNEKNMDKIEFEDNEFDNLEDYFDMAINYYEEGNYQEALNYANMMLKIDPDSAGAFFIKSKIAYLDNDLKNAKEYFKRAVLLNNSLLKTKLAKKLEFESVPSLSKEECALYAQKSYYKGDINLSIEYLKKYLAWDKENIDIYLMLISCYLKNQDIQSAKDTLLQAQKISPDNISLMLYAFDFDQGNKREQILLKAYQINPNNRALLLKLANYYLDKKDYETSKKYFELLTKVDDSLYEGYFGYFYTLVETNETDKAQSLIRILPRLNRNQAEISFLLSKLCSAKGEYKEAINYIYNSLKTDKNPYYLFEAGRLNFVTGDYSASAKYLEGLNTPEGDEYLIADYIKLNNLSQAHRVLAGSKIDKNGILYKYYLYKISQPNNNKELDSILKHRPRGEKEYIDLARINYLEGRYEAMNRILNKAEKKFDDNAQIKFASGELRFKNE